MYDISGNILYPFKKIIYLGINLEKKEIVWLVWGSC